MAKCACRCLDVKLARGWLGTCGEYSGYLLRPVPRPLGLRLWPFCKQLALKEHEAAFKDWSVLQFWFGILAGVLVTVTDLVEGNPAGYTGVPVLGAPVSSLIMCLFSGTENTTARLVGAMVSGCMRVFAAFVFSHLWWYSAVRRHGCCCVVLACCEGRLLLLVWCMLAMIWGIVSLATITETYSLLETVQCFWCVVVALVRAFHAVTLFYMSFAVLNIWRLGGADIVPPGAEVKGPEDQAVGTAGIV